MSESLRTIKSYVIRKGRMSDAQNRAMSDHFARYASRQDEQIPFNKLFNKAQPLVLEIGFGMGQALIQHAKLHPEFNFIGIEVHPPGIGAVLQLIAQDDLPNVRIIKGDAVLALKTQCLDNTLSQIHIFFPDPWPKKRHHKRRLIQPEFVSLLAQKLAPLGILHLATDWQPYAEHMREVIAMNPQFKLLDTERGERALTKFEQKGLTQGHPVADLKYQKS